MIFARASTLKRSPGLVRPFLRATSEGYALARSDPAKALSDLEHGAHGIDPAVARASLKAYRPILADAQGDFGRSIAPPSSAFLRYARRVGIIPGATRLRSLVWSALLRDLDEQVGGQRVAVLRAPGDDAPDVGERCRAPPCRTPRSRS